jgi:hypothetical protein
MNVTRSAFARGAALLLVLTLASCNDGPTSGDVPQPGEMTATLISPNGAEGSALLEVGSGTVLDVTPVGSYVRAYRVAANPVRIVVLRLEPGDITFRLTTDDVNRPPELRVVDIGGPDDQLRPSLSGYSVSLTVGAGS